MPFSEVYRKQAALVAPNARVLAERKGRECPEE